MKNTMEAAYMAITLVAILMTIYQAAWSPLGRCANRRDGIWVSAIARCYSVTDFGIPQRALEVAR